MNDNNLLDEKLVSKVLTKRFPAFEGPWSAEKTANGQSNPTFILSGSRKKLVLRRKPDGDLLSSAHLIDREFKVMKALESSDVPVPHVYYFSDDKSEIGSEYFIMDYVHGNTFVDPSLPMLTNYQRATVYDEMNTSLAALHRIDPEKIGLSKFGKMGNYFSRQLARWSKQYEYSATEYILEMELLREWLFENIPKEVVKPRLVHGDWRIDNIIFCKDSYKVIAVIDWELSTLGDPRVDLAGQLMQWSMPGGVHTRGLKGTNRNELGLPEDKKYIEDYAAKALLSDVPDLRFATAFCYFRMGAILQGVKKRAIDGNASNPEKGLEIGSHVQDFAVSALEFVNKS